MELTQAKAIFQDLVVSCGPFGPPLGGSREVVMLAPHNEI